MKQTQLIIAAINAIAYEPNLTHAVLDENVATIQQALGVENGDLAGVLLDLDVLAENDSMWRIRCMTEYIAHELRELCGTTSRDEIA